MHTILLPRRHRTHQNVWCVLFLLGKRLVCMSYVCMTPDAPASIAGSLSAECYCMTQMYTYCGAPSLLASVAASVYRISVMTLPLQHGGMGCPQKLNMCVMHWGQFRF